MQECKKKKYKNKAYVTWHISETQNKIYFGLEDDGIHADTCSKLKNLCRR